MARILVLAACVLFLLAALILVFSASVGAPPLGLIAFGLCAWAASGLV
jgi:hypothetical protein